MCVARVGSGGFCVSLGGIRWILCESGWDQVDSVCVSGGFRWVPCVYQVILGGFCVSQGGIRWILCELGWNQVGSV